MFAFPLRKQFNFGFYAGYEAHLDVFVVASSSGHFSDVLAARDVMRELPAYNLRGSPDGIFPIFSVSADLEEEYFTLEEIKEKLEYQRLGWKSKFKGGLEKIEVENIEESLGSREAKEEVRYDFTFYTPTCRYVRVKVSFLISSNLLTEKN